MSTQRGRDVSSLPPCELLTVAKRGVEVFRVERTDAAGAETQQGEKTELRKVAGWENLKGCEVAEWSPCGHLLGLAASHGIELIDPEHTYHTIATLSTGRPCQRLYFSPKGTFVVALTQFVPTENEKNVQLWDVATREKKAAFTLKGLAAQEKWPPLIWTPEEKYCFRLMPSELEIFPGNLENGLTPASKFSVKKAKGFAPSAEKEDGSVLFAIFTPPASGGPARIQVLRLVNPTARPELLNSKSFYQAQDIKIEWNKQSTAVLATAYVDVDNSGKSYYGSSSLYFLEASANGASYQLVGPDKGPISDFRWSPSANEFIVISGPVPPTVNMHDGRTGDARLSFGQPRRNTIRFNPFGRFICLGGFGNLAGDMDIWDKNKKKIIGSAKAPCTVDCEWSPDGRMILSTTTTPRMRVDNCVKLFRYNGDLLVKMDIPDLYAAAWRPVAPNPYPDRAVSRDRVPNIVPEKTTSVYRPPKVSEQQRPQRSVAELQTTATVISSKPVAVSDLPVGADYVTSKSKSAKRNAARRKKKAAAAAGAATEDV